ncbi:post-GPI attachment to proteins factor 2 [Strongylocentrotus purpuratus]|uniref:CWH43-like N-terminal domain-containing protein n=1 Tax=Strongylocentrotus purpuratus TaxID=7668 RepID=A0A7M7GA43_STRPU|nr:post-GPI attachment to proteins factor 2 [Strongylocentrotus purpuratus]
MGIVSGPSRFTSNGIKISLPAAVTITSWIIILGFMLSILCAVLINFEDTTETHCHVPNFLPSFSAAIATAPSSYIWRLTVTLSSAQRVTAVFGHYSLYSSLPDSTGLYQFLCQLCAVLEMTENLALIGLTCVSSRELYEIHEMFFITFQASSMLYMMFMCLLFRMATNLGPAPTEGERHILHKKLALFFTNLVAFISAMYFFFRHNWYCEPGVYSLFACCEYLVVITNIIFHIVVSTYFEDRELRLGCRINSKK